MQKRKSPAVRPRKTPKQERSAQLVADILEAAIRVLERDGAVAFTTTRVAAQAGISVGSLYQYFPNKESILFRLQVDEWGATAALLEGIFGDERLAPAERLRAALHAFFRTECDEAPLRRALGDAAPFYRDVPQAREHRERGQRVIVALIGRAAPKLSAKRRAFAAELYLATLSAMGKHVSETVQTRAEVDRWAAATADMFLAYLQPRSRN
ncbi:MAG: hypothetical protein RLZZ450_1976 [Pseudomonadota bacterium]|jgi:AcrR family transcriptional regulator